MVAPRNWIIVGLLCLAGFCLPVLGAAEEPSAEVLWENGQNAMRHGRPRQAITFYRKSLTQSPDFTRNYLSLAAAYLALGDRRRGCVNLAKYTRAHPDEIDIRSDYAELLAQMHRDPEARAEFEACIAAAQELGRSAYGQLVRCHRRVMEIAEAQQDAYAEHLHRGIGLFVLAQESAAAGAANAELSSEALFFKAAGELTLAREEKPDEARPSWYLYVIWSRLNQRQPAARCLNQAGAAAPFSYLTPLERRTLHLACQAPERGTPK